MKEDWPFALAQVCEDLQHIPLSNAGHISIMVDGAPSRSACGHLSQLEVSGLLQVDGKVVYPEGLDMGVWNLYGLLSPNYQFGTWNLPVSPLNCK